MAASGKHPRKKNRTSGARRAGGILWTLLQTAALQTAPVPLAPAQTVAATRVAAQHVTRSAGRARPPGWKNLPSIFFSNAFDQALRGPRPARLTPGQPLPTPAHNSAGTTSPGPPAAGPPSAGPQWSTWASASVLEDEVKRLHLALQTTLASERRFRAGDYKAVEAQLSLAATWLAVISQYDQPIRWKDVAAAAAVTLAEGASQAHEGTVEAYQAAVGCQTLMDDLVRGARPAVRGAQPIRDWSPIAPRSALMKRLDLASQERLRPWTATADDLRQHHDAVRHEAAVVATLAQVLVQPGMEDAADGDYAALCGELGALAGQLGQAVASQDAPRAGATAARLRQTCQACHEQYR